VKTVQKISELRREVAAGRARHGYADRRRGGPVVGLVPTMGYLHEGHLALVDRARQRTELVVLSVFVNPTQFSPGEDFDRYPRDLDRDAELAEHRGVELLFTPTVGEVYPEGNPLVRVVPRGMADRLCGAGRPGHFEGVLTVVAKLFGMVEPDVAVFGQKDYQQATLIRRMVRDLNMSVSIDVAPIVRDPDGLALSSRNAYLSDGERERALSLWQGLSAARAAFERGEQDGALLREAVRGPLADAGVEIEYVDLVDPDTLEPLASAAAGGVLAVAARVGSTRLIDNMLLGQSD
jgi:pantoate--beta-alanine ligase